MSTLTKKVILEKLSSLHQRKLEKGEILLLARAIAFSLPLIPAEIEQPSIYVKGHGGLIDDIWYNLREYSHVTEEQHEFLKESVTKFLIWRTDIANGTSLVLFSDKPDAVIDDLSSLPRLFDVGTLCSVGDVIANANWMLKLFTDLVTYHKSKDI